MATTPATDTHLEAFNIATTPPGTESTTRPYLARRVGGVNGCMMRA
jgi:hypothetical protein